MQKYANYGGDSGVDSFELFDGGIIVRFNDGKHYEYSSTLIGAQNLATMHELALAGEGLNSFINRNPVVRTGYSRKW